MWMVLLDFVQLVVYIYIYIEYNIIGLAAYADYRRLYFLFYSSDSATIIQPESYDLFTDINYSVNTLDLNN